MQNISPFQKVLEQFRSSSLSERDKGDKFERLVQTYLKTDPTYKDKLTDVWLWSEFPCNNDFAGGKDLGIDLVCKTKAGEFWAVQCKFYDESTPITKEAVDTFLSTSGKQFTDNGTQLKTRFTERLWVSTSDNWSSNAEDTIYNQQTSVTRIGLTALESSMVDWEQLSKGISGEQALQPKKHLREHQLTALKHTHDHYKSSDRGKLIMACGTGKTFTSLKIAEHETDGKGLILFLVPSIALLGQTLREWSAQADKPINSVCICSDSRISETKARRNDINIDSVVDLGYPATTDVDDILHQFKEINKYGTDRMTVVFSTYQSIERIAEAQKVLLANGYPEFDLIICDEAHRTTGVTLKEDDDESSFVKVHSNDFVKAKKRLYMTATPKLYGEDAKSKADEMEAVLCSMDDESLFGENIYTIGFGEAVQRGLLCDYKVLILTVSDADVPKAVQDMVADKNVEINSTDAAKLIGCINALSKQILGDSDMIKSSDPEPMHRAVAFCQTIEASKKITNAFSATQEKYVEDLSQEQKQEIVNVSSDHIDGSMGANIREKKMNWLKDGDVDKNECRILTNVRCLSEGVDVPTLDAVMFLSPRNSQIEVVQSVGRVMRTAEGKKYGYIIIPIVVPSDVEAEKALDKNEAFKVVWEVLRALRSHDDRFNATINKIELNRAKPANMLIGRPAARTKDDFLKGGGLSKEYAEYARQMTINYEPLQNVIYGKIVQKVGQKRYWEQWAKDVAGIATRYVERITRLIKEDNKHSKAFESFLKGLQKNINPSITQGEAVDMLAQHLITKPVFEALFEDYSFVGNNAISVSMQKMLDLLEEQSLDKDTHTLNKFYESVKERAKVDNAEAKQKIIVELYDKFFKTAFPKMVEQLGIVYTPVPVVDFIIQSVDVVLRKEFGRCISDENVHILDPFTGTGTFVTRLLQSGLIRPEDLHRKYSKELHANEIVLLAYYIAAINIENAFHDLTRAEGYTPFDGICLTDTFQLGETDDSDKLFSAMFQKNSKRVIEQKKAPIRIIIGNPPYSIGQKSANDNAQNQSYTKLDAKIAATYAEQSSAGLNKSLYDAYIKAFRWSTDRLDPENGGIVAFVSNGAWIDGNSADGFRKCVESEFSAIYVFNLRGNQRTSGELSRQEGGKIFGSGSRTPIAITLLIKKPKSSTEAATIHYHDIGDYLSREDKLKIIDEFKSIKSIDWQTLSPNEHGDWLNKRNDIFDTFIPLAPEKKFDGAAKSVFMTYAIGLASNRDAWVYNFSKREVEANMQRMIEFYNHQLSDYRAAKQTNDKLQVEEFIDTDATKISWTRALRNNLKNYVAQNLSVDSFRYGQYRPFCKQQLYYAEEFIESPGLSRRLFPYSGVENLIIGVSGVGAQKEFAALITNSVSDLQVVDKAQYFPLYYYDDVDTKDAATLFDDISKDKYIRRDAISDFILERCRANYGNKVSKEDIFYYVYGILHSTEYRTQFASDLKKMLPRLPLVDEPKEFWAFSKAGQALAELHLNYETIEPSKEARIIFNGGSQVNYRVEKMRFGKDGKEVDKTTILYNHQITVENIPLVAYEYIVNGKSAIEWIMERYQITTHKDSGIPNDPNDWADEHNDPKYILNLLLRIIRLSVDSVHLINSLPTLKFE